MTTPDLSQWIADFWHAPGVLPELGSPDMPVPDAPPDDAASLYREAWYAGMAEGPEPGAD